MQSIFLRDTCLSIRHTCEIHVCQWPKHTTFKKTEMRIMINWSLSSLEGANNLLNVLFSSILTLKQWWRFCQGLGGVTDEKERPKSISSLKGRTQLSWYFSILQGIKYPPSTFRGHEQPSKSGVGDIQHIFVLNGSFISWWKSGQAAILGVTQCCKQRDSFKPCIWAQTLSVILINHVLFCFYMQSMSPDLI